MVLLVLRGSYLKFGLIAWFAWGLRTPCVLHVRRTYWLPCSRFPISTWYTVRITMYAKRTTHIRGICILGQVDRLG